MSDNHKLMCRFLSAQEVSTNNPYMNDQSVKKKPLLMLSQMRKEKERPVTKLVYFLSSVTFTVYIHKHAVVIV